MDSAVVAILFLVYQIVGSRPVFYTLNYFLFYPEISTKINALDIIWPRDHLIKLEEVFSPR
jgi:hypothetical protein